MFDIFFYFPGSWKPEFFLTARIKDNFDGPGNIFNELLLVKFLIFMIEEHTNFHCQQLTRRVLNSCLRYVISLPCRLKNGTFLSDSQKQGQLWWPRNTTQLIVFYSIIRFLVPENVNFLSSITCKYDYSCFPYFIQLPGGWKIRKILPGFSTSLQVPWWRINIIHSATDGQTDSNLNDIYTINTQIPKISVGK